VLECAAVLLLVLECTAVLLLVLECAAVLLLRGFIQIPEMNT